MQCKIKAHSPEGIVEGAAQRGDEGVDLVVLGLRLRLRLGGVARVQTHQLRAASTIERKGENMVRLRIIQNHSGHSAPWMTQACSRSSNSSSSSKLRTCKKHTLAVSCILTSPAPTCQGLNPHPTSHPHQSPPPPLMQAARLTYGSWHRGGPRPCPAGSCWSPCPPGAPPTGLPPCRATPQTLRMDMGGSIIVGEIEGKRI